MSKVFFGFAVADSMFNGDCSISRKKLSATEAKAIIASGVIPCLNPSHQATINAMRSRFGINIMICQPSKKPELRWQACKAK